MEKGITGKPYKLRGILGELIYDETLARRIAVQRKKKRIKRIPGLGFWVEY
jgi:hypothetical protein